MLARPRKDTLITISLAAALACLASHPARTGPSLPYALTSATPHGPPPPPADQPTFNSDLPMEVCVPAPETWAGCKTIGRTPAPPPGIPLPADGMWFVVPTVSGADKQTLERIVKELKDKKILGLSLANATGIETENFSLFAPLTDLKWLDLSGNDGLPENLLPGMTNLVYLDISRTNSANDTLRQLAGLTKLQTLDLGLNLEIDDEGLPTLAPLAGLKDLDLGGSGVAGPGLDVLQSFTQLERLALDQCTELDLAVALPKLVPLKNLHSLDLSFSSFDEHELTGLAQLTQLTALDLTNCALTDAQLKPVAALTGLATLNLALNQITDAGLALLKNLKGLTSLRLGGNPITEAGLHHLKALTLLKSLALSRVSIKTEEALESLLPLKNLEFLDLSGNECVTDRTLEIVAKLPALKQLVVKSTRSPRRESTSSHRHAPAWR